jgi:predicted NBD/HSP70 family sugar kinase
MNSGLMSPNKMQDYNAYIVLRLIREEGPISRAEIARKLGSSKSAISNITTLLDSYGLIEEAGQGNPHTGRKSTLLQFNPKSYYFISADIRWKKTNIAIVDLEGNICKQVDYRNIEKDPISIIDGVVENIKKLLNSSKISEERIEGVGIMIPGVVDYQHGIVLYSGPLKWHEPFKLSEEFRKRIDIPVYVENDANALALGETWIGKGQPFSQVAYLYTEGGLGGAYVHNREIFQGCDYTATQIGKFIVYDKDGIRDAESCLSLPGILETNNSALNIQKMTHEDAISEGQNILDIEKNGWTAQTTGIVDVLAQLISNMILVLNPEIIIIHSAYLLKCHIFSEELHKRVKNYLPEFPYRTVNIQPAFLSDKTEVLGGAAVALSQSRFYPILLQNN